MPEWIWIWWGVVAYLTGAAWSAAILIQLKFEGTTKNNLLAISWQSVAWPLILLWVVFRVFVVTEIDEDE